VRAGGFQHFQMDLRILVSRKADVTNLASLPCINYCFDRAAPNEYTIRIVHPDDLMKPQQVEMIGLQPLQ
jgi:hypothetical protein